MLRNFQSCIISPLERGDKGVCKFAVTHPQPLFLEGSLEVAAAGSLIYDLKNLLNKKTNDYMEMNT